MVDPDCGESGRAPGEQHVNVHGRPTVVFERLANGGTEYSKGPDHPRRISTEHTLEHELGDLGGDVAPQSMHFAARRSVDDVDAIGECRHERWNFLRRVLKIVIQR